MTDIIDKTQENEEIFLAEALYKARPSETAADSLYECDDCGATIPEARRQAVKGCTRCVFCQEYFEHGYP